MDIISIFEKQLELGSSSDELYKTNIFFNEYFSVFNKNPNFKENTKKYYINIAKKKYIRLLIF
ncbi:hypothetical protein ACTQ4P_17505 [Clostridium sporogenes]|uniref:hypothetical protein n=1 Tax=Clostridium sporogenes TaxID=1509 RepID=UPI002902BAF8|nr:hypothetical protein [Clostridium botulinum]